MDSTRYAGFWRRLAAVAVDAILLSTLMLFGLVAWISLTGETHAWDSNPMALAFYGSLLAALVLKILLDAWLGGTPGLHLADCRLADARTGKRITVARSALRTLAIALSVLPLLLGLLWIAWDSRGQSWHDKLANTIVIREDDSLRSLAELSGEAM
jgi:uncharacterized RDD family membrane protein YckC